LVSRAAIEGSRALSRGEEMLAKGDVDGAIKWFRIAARWYVPKAPHVAEAHDRLTEIAELAETRNDVATSLAAWRASRAAILATRSFYTPHAERLEPANRAISRLMAVSEARELAPSATDEERAEFHYELLARDESPSTAWFLFAMLGFVLWLGGGFYFAFRGVSKEGQLQRRYAATSGVLIAVKTDIEFISKLSVFAGLESRVLDIVAEHGTRLTVEDGQMLFREGEPAKEMVVVVSGRLDIVKKAKDGEACIASLGPGDVAGEMSLIDIQPRSADVLAVGHTTLVALSHGDIGRIYREHPESYTLLLRNIAREISLRLRRLDTMLANIIIDIRRATGRDPGTREDG
jgi:CRP-like cAMP-binding protein